MHYRLLDKCENSCRLWLKKGDFAVIQPNFNPKILCVYTDYNFCEILNFKDVMRDLMSGDLYALDLNFSVHDLSDWGSTKPQSGWNRWLMLSEAIALEQQKMPGTHADVEFFRTGKGTIVMVPHVCIYREKMSKRGTHSGKPSRLAVFIRDRYKCIYCGEPVSLRKGKNTSEDSYATIDHIVPQAKWVAWAKKFRPGYRMESWNNLGTSCYRCNHKKGDQMNEDAGLVPLSKPYAPKWMIHKSIHLKPNQMKSSWERFMFPEDGKKKK
jgi:5-methylcytosine-specific restriction endonuclease McrA